MEILTQRNLIMSVTERWREQYRNTRDFEKVRTGARLHKLDKTTATPEDVAKIIGNRSWTQIVCDECGEEVTEVVLMGGRMGPRYTRCFCGECLEQAAQTRRRG